MTQFDTVVKHPFELSPTCASAVVEIYGPVYIATTMLQVCSYAVQRWCRDSSHLISRVAVSLLQCMAWAAVYLISDTPLFRRSARHMIARLTCRSANMVVVGGHGIPMYLAYAYVGSRCMVRCRVVSDLYIRASCHMHTATQNVWLC